MTGTANNGWEDSPGGIVSGKPGLAHAGPVVHDQSRNFIVTHFVAVFCLLEKTLITGVLSGGSALLEWGGLVVAGDHIARASSPRFAHTAPPEADSPGCGPALPSLLIWSYRATRAPIGRAASGRDRALWQRGAGLPHRCSGLIWG